MTQRYAILLNGRFVDYCDTPAQASYWMSHGAVELIEIAKASKVVVQYTELSGPWGYGHQEESFVTYGGLLPCIRRLYAWIQEQARFWGPDPLEIKDYFRNCRLYVNDTDKSAWLFKQIDKINTKTIFA